MPDPANYFEVDEFELETFKIQMLEFGYYTWPEEDASDTYEPNIGQLIAEYHWPLAGPEMVPSRLWDKIPGWCRGLSPNSNIRRQHGLLDSDITKKLDEIYEPYLANDDCWEDIYIYEEDLQE